METSASGSTANETAQGKPTLAAVAARAGVSVSTASLTFSGAGPVSDSTREKVLAAAAELGYAGPDPRAQSLRRGRSGIVGVVVEERISESFRDPVMIATLDGISEGISETGAALLLLPDTGGETIGVGNAPVDAVVLISCSPRFDESLATLESRGIPTITIEGTVGGDLPGVTIENRAATQRAAEHVRSLGHERVAIVMLPLDAARTRGPLTPEREAAATSWTPVERLAGARAVFPDAPAITAGGSAVDEGLIAGRALLEAPPSERPTAIIAQSDLLAIGVIRAAEELGLDVPGDVSVVGFDGIELEGLSPYVLTTLVQPAAAKGRAAGELVVRMLAGEHPESVSLATELRVGTTTAPPRA